VIRRKSLDSVASRKARGGGGGVAVENLEGLAGRVACEGQLILDRPVQNTYLGEVQQETGGHTPFCRVKR